MRLSVIKYAEHRKAKGLSGQTKQAVMKALNTGRIWRENDGLIDVATADACWAGSTDPSKQRTPEQNTPIKYRDAEDGQPGPERVTAADLPEYHVLGTAKRKREAVPDVAPVRPSPSLQSSLEFNAARTRRESIRERRESLEFDLLQGKVAEVDAICVEWFQTSHQIMKRLMAIPARVSADCAAMTDAHAITLLLERELRATLEDLLADPPGLPDSAAPAVAAARLAAPASDAGVGMGGSVPPS